jgi:glycosyltransferase involved in cell wall biosynthesis
VSKLRITFLTHYFPPEVGAPQIRMFELARHLVAAGESVTVVTAFPNYPTGVVHDGYRGRFAMEEEMDGVRVLRRWVFATPNTGFFKRLLNHLSFVVTSLTALRAIGPTDVIYVQSPPLFIGLAALAFSRLKRAPFVFNVSDIWPQSAIELGMLHNRAAIWLAEKLEWHLYRRACRVTVPTPGMRARLIERGLSPEKVVLLTNGVDTSLYQPEPPDPKLANQLGLNGHKIFLYAGTHGLSQGLDVILEAAKRTTDEDVVYVLAGEGADKEALVEKARSEGITNVHFLPNQPKSAMPGLLNLAFAAIVPLKPLDLFKDALPSKMFESMAVGQPIVASLWGEAAKLVETAGCGIVAEPGDPAALEAAVKKLAADPTSAKAMGRRGREYVVEHFDRQKIAQRLRALLAACVDDESRI